VVLDERADTRRGFLTTQKVVLCIRFRFDRGAVVLHVRATGVATYEGVAYRLTANHSIDFGMSVKCRVDFRNVRAQCPDIPLNVTEPKRQFLDKACNFYDGARQFGTMPNKRVDPNSLFDENGNLITSATPLMKKEAKAAKAKQEQKTKPKATQKKGSKNKNTVKSKKKNQRNTKNTAVLRPFTRRMRSTATTITCGQITLLAHEAMLKIEALERLGLLSSLTSRHRWSHGNQEIPTLQPTLEKLR
jgi:hypothetical protein